MTYQSAAGWNNTAGLVDLDPQPARKEPLRYAEINYSGIGESAPNGYLQGSLIYTGLERSQLGTVLGQHGLSLTVTSARRTMTILMDSNDSTWENVNVIVQYEMRFNRSNPGILRDLEIQLNRIEIIVS